MTETEGIGIFVQNVNQTTFNFVMNCEDNSIQNTQLSFNYTDKYHINTEEWKSISFNLNVFLSEPPRFVDEILDFQINLCSSTLFLLNLPQITDPDSYIFTISLPSDLPDWIKITENNKVLINTLSGDFNLNSDIFQTTLKVSDDSNSWTKYPFVIRFEHLSVVKFDYINDITVRIGESITIPISAKDLKIESRTCDGNSINWICYSAEKESLFILDQTQCSFSYNYCNTSSLIGEYCIQLYSIDMCNTTVTSNSFKVTIKQSAPSAISNSLGPIYTYPNYYKEVPIPNDLFIQISGSQNYFKAVNCVENSVNIASRVQLNDDNSRSLFIKVFGDKGCKLSLSDTTTYCQSSEVLVDVIVQKCASKVCTQCKGSYESDCLQCEQGYILDKSGTCLKHLSYFPMMISAFYWICGLFSMIAILLQILLAFRYGRGMLEPIVHIQTVMMYVLSSDNVNKDWIEYLSWLQYFKFDFGFINFHFIDNIIQCTSNSSKLYNSKLFCDEVIYNYLNLILLIFIVIILHHFLKFLTLCYKIIKCNKLLITQADAFWIYWFIINPYLIINTYYDLSSIKAHLLSSFILIIILLCAALYSLKTKLCCFRISFIYNLDPSSDISYLYLNLLYRIPYICIFISSSVISSMLVIVILIMQTTLCFKKINTKVKLPLMKNFDRASSIFCQGIMQIVVMIISIEKLCKISFTSINLKSSSSYEISSASICVLLLTVMFMCLLLLSVFRVASDFIVSQSKKLSDVHSQ